MQTFWLSTSQSANFGRYWHSYYLDQREFSVCLQCAVCVCVSVSLCFCFACVYQDTPVCSLCICVYFCPYLIYSNVRTPSSQPMRIIHKTWNMRNNMLHLSDLSYVYIKHFALCCSRAAIVAARVCVCVFKPGSFLPGGNRLWASSFNIQAVVAPDILIYNWFHIF